MRHITELQCAPDLSINRALIMGFSMSLAAIKTPAQPAHKKRGRGAPPKTDEEKRVSEAKKKQSFLVLAPLRVDAIVRDLAKLARCANGRSFSSSPEQIDQMRKTVMLAVTECFDAFDDRARGGAKAKRFQFES